jgi:hypothetical protein
MYTIYYFCRVLIDPSEEFFLGNAAGVSGVQVVRKTRLGLNLVIFKKSMFKMAMTNDI